MMGTSPTTPTTHFTSTKVEDSNKTNPASPDKCDDSLSVLEEHEKGLQCAAPDILMRCQNERNEMFQTTSENSGVNVTSSCRVDTGNLVAETPFCSKVLMEECNMPAYLEKSDGLLQVIIEKVNAPGGDETDPPVLQSDVDLHDKSLKSFQECDTRKTEASTVVTEEKQDERNCHSETNKNNANNLSIIGEKVDDLVAESDKINISEIREQEKLGPQGCEISVAKKSVDISLKEEIVQNELGFTSEISSSELSKLPNKVQDTQQLLSVTNSLNKEVDVRKELVAASFPVDYAVLPQKILVQSAPSSEVNDKLTTDSCHISSEHDLDPLTTVSCGDHLPHGMKAQENEGLFHKSDSIEDDSPLTFKKEKYYCQTEFSSQNPKGINAVGDDKHHCFEIRQSSEEHSEKNNGLELFSSIQSLDGPGSGKHTLGNRGDDKCDSDRVSEASKKLPIVSIEEKRNNFVMKSTEVDTNCNLGTDESGFKRRTAKEKPISKKAARAAHRSGTKGSSSRTGPGVLILDGLQQSPTGEVKSSPTSQMRSAPNSTAAAKTPLVLQQPFTDSQQIQLRSQIYAYGSLIQGYPPDEACMVSAFGDVDAGWSKWETAWRTAVKKYGKQKSLPGCDAPVSPQVTTSNQASRSSPLQKKLIVAQPCSTGSGNSAPTSVLSPLSLPPPIWNRSALDKSHSNTPRGLPFASNQMPPPLHAYQSTHFLQYSASCFPWLAQPPIVSWTAPHDSAAVGKPQLPISSVTETIQLTSPRDSSISHNCGIPFMSPGVSSATRSKVSDSTASAVQDTAIRNEVASGAIKDVNAVPMSRRKKKSMVPGPKVQVPSNSEPHSRLDATAGSANLMFSAATASASIGASSSVGFPIISPAHFQVVASGVMGSNIILSDETLGKIEQAKLQAEDAAAFAATAIRYSETTWSQLAAQVNSRVLTTEVEQRLVSAAAAAAAAASVAKAASAAAKVAADSAWHAKLMADEAVASKQTAKVPHFSEAEGQCSENNLSADAPNSTSEVKNSKAGSHSTIPATKKAPLGRSQAAAAIRKSGNNDDVLKAAECAAQTVAQAGSIVAMGDVLPFSLRQIIELGPESYWKSQNSILEPLTENMNGGVSGVSTPPVCGDDKDQEEANLHENTIQEGSFVEVLTDVKGIAGVWCSARVLNMKDGKACVRFNDLLSDEGDKLMEWVSFGSEDEKPPRIRIVHPFAANKCDSSRKRQRPTDSWVVGDHVDVSTKDGWQEGVVAEKKKGGTKLIVRFLDAGGGDSKEVRTSDLRQSLVWRDGQWMAWLSSPNDTQHHEAYLSHQKKLKNSKREGKSTSEAEILKATKIPNYHCPADLKKTDVTPSASISQENPFSFRKSGEEEDLHRVNRVGLQKEGPKVVSGIPKPVKKRKFMNVSKHCVVGATEKEGKGIQGSKSTKFAKYLMPQTSTRWKRTSKVDSGSNQAVDWQPKMVSVKSRKFLNSSDKKSSFASGFDAPNEGGNHAPICSKPSIQNAKKKSAKKNHVELDSTTANNTGAAGGHGLVSQSQQQPLVSSATATASNADVEKETLTQQNSIVNEDKDPPDISDKVGSDGRGPRRSNRRIQPTSRLLEGLQSSSLIVVKAPTVSHAKGGKVSQRIG